MTKKSGRPSSYTEAVGDEICERISNGESLRQICADESLPSRSSVFRWLDDPEMVAFRNQYARAHEFQAEHYAAEIVGIADEEVTMVRAEKHGTKDEDGNGNTEVVFDAAAVARNRLRVDARKWVASKLSPKKYGDRLGLTDGEGKPLQSTIVVPVFNIGVTTE